MSRNFVIISGCSGGGKSTLLAELARRGWPVVQEPGRRIVLEQNASGGPALPWVDMDAFLGRAMELALADRAGLASESGWVFFDRSLVDAASALSASSGDDRLEMLCAGHAYHRTVFMTPPWAEIFASDAERRHGFPEAVAEYERLCVDYPRLGYRVVTIPRTNVGARADFVIDALNGY